VTVRLIAIILVGLLLSLCVSVPSVTACSATACCGPNCSGIAPVGQLSCCKAPLASDQAINQACETQHFDSIGYGPAAIQLVAISHLLTVDAARGHSPPDRRASLALLCSRQI
jgi:hypothetical protein